MLITRDPLHAQSPYNPADFRLNAWLGVNTAKFDFQTKC